MSCMTTFSGEDFDPTQPEPAKIHLGDIAHALSMICRANGHFAQFYSVAQHCVNCAVEARARGHSPRVQLACLLHDASEAYMADIIRPVKSHLPNYKELERQLQDMIDEKYIGAPLTKEEHALVKEIDNAVLVCEFDALMPKQVFDHRPQMYGQLQFAFTGFEASEQQFLQLAESLTAQA